MFKINVTNADPTGTLPIANAWIKEFNKRFNNIKRAIRQFIVVDDKLGIKQTKKINPFKRNFEFTQDSNKLNDFLEFLQVELQAEIIGDTTNGNWSDIYVETSYKKSINDAINTIYGKVQQGVLSVAFSNPVHAETLSILYSRVYEELKGINAEMSKQMARSLADSLANGHGAIKTAKNLYNIVDNINTTRAKVIARTETIRAYSEGTLNQFENMGQNVVIGKVESSTAEDERVCQTCIDLSLNTFTIKEARGLIPVHPNCRCRWLPVVETITEKK